MKSLDSVWVQKNEIVIRDVYTFVCVHDLRSLLIN